jgi:hypothetical protein
MTPQQVLDYYGTQAEIARVLGCKQPSVAEWFDKNEVPEGRQYQLEIASGGKLKADKPADRNDAAKAVIRTPNYIGPERRRASGAR